MRRFLPVILWRSTLRTVRGPNPAKAVYEEMTRHFPEEEIVDLTLAIITINGWNRLAIPFRTPPGSYKPHAVASREPGGA